MAGITLMERLKAQMAGTPTPQQTQPLPAPVNTVNVSTPKAAEDEVKKLLDEERAISAFAPVENGICSACGAEVNESNGSRKSGVWKHIGCPAGSKVLPPDVPVNVKKAEPLPAETPVSPAIKAAADRVASNTPIDEAPKAKPGRPKKNPQPETESVVQTIEKIGLLQGGICLFVDCMSSEFSTPLDPYVDAICKALCEEFHAADLRCAPNDSPLGFGKWKGALAAAIKANPPEGKIYSLLFVKGNELKEVVAEALRPLCNFYVRGL